MIFSLSVMGLTAIITLICLLVSIYRERKVWNNGICLASGKPWVPCFIDGRDDNCYSGGDGNYFDFQYNCVTNTWPDIWTKKIF